MLVVTVNAGKRTEDDSVRGEWRVEYQGGAER
jgi:hypothetical protein